MEDTYYVYLDEKKKKYYYFNTLTNKSTYKKPSTGKLLDPETGTEWVEPKFPVKENSDKHKTKTRRRSLSTVSKKREQRSQTVLMENPNSNSFNFSGIVPDINSDNPGNLQESNPEENITQESIPDESIIEPKIDSLASDSAFDLDIPIEVIKFTPVCGQVSLRPKSFMPGEDGNTPSLPRDLSEDIHKFKIEKYAQQYFREHRSKHLFQRRKISTEELISFSPEPLQAPLLLCLKEEESQKAIQIFKEILIYTGVEPSKKPYISAEKIVKILDEYPILRDETFFQIIKQTRNNNREDVLEKTWHLFLIIATFFPSTQDSELYIMSHLSDFCRSPNPIISVYAKFTYIRFCGRCSVGKPLVTKDLSLIQKIPSHPMDFKQIFGSSIYEQLWNQKDQYPNLPIPFYFHKIIQDLLNKNCQEQEGIFRINGDIKKIDTIANKINNGTYDVSECTINDLAGLLKHWIRELPVGMIPFSKLGDLLTICEDGTLIQFVDKLPKAHCSLLKYLIGFLKIIAQNSEVNLMKPHNLAVCFTPTVIKIQEDLTQDYYRKYSDSGIQLLLTLIESWDVSDFFPLDEKYFNQ